MVLCHNNWKLIKEVFYVSSHFLETFHLTFKDAYIIWSYLPQIEASCLKSSPISFTTFLSQSPPLPPPRTFSSAPLGMGGGPWTGA